MLLRCLFWFALGLGSISAQAAFQGLPDAEACQPQDASLASPAPAPFTLTVSEVTVPCAFLDSGWLGAFCGQGHPLPRTEGEAHLCQTELWQVVWVYDRPSIPQHMETKAQITSSLLGWGALPGSPAGGLSPPICCARPPSGFDAPLGRAERALGRPFVPG